jgi:hypothetical protein
MHLNVQYIGGPFWRLYFCPPDVGLTSASWLIILLEVYSSWKKLLLQIYKNRKEKIKVKGTVA